MIRLVLSELDFDYELHALVCGFFPGCRCNVSVFSKMCELLDGKENFTEDVLIGCGFTSGDDSFFITIYFGREKICAAAASPDGHFECGSVCGLDGDRDFHKLERKKKHPYRTEYKNKLKRLVFCLLRDFVQEHLPSGMYKCVPEWGTMTGVRPTKIAMDGLLCGRGYEDVKHILESEYCLSPDKSELCVQVAEREKEIFGDRDYGVEYSLYVGIPFCPTTCLYCSFTSYPMERYKDIADNYLNALEREIKAVSEFYAGRKLTSVYVGGGTPTALSSGQLDRLLSIICSCFDVSGCSEFTVEAGRPDSITKEKLSVISRYGVGRISINPQTMQEKTLKLIGRRHSPKQVVESFNLAREMGFSNINMDLIIGLPQEGVHDFEDTLKKIGVLKPDSLTVHSLVVKRGSKLRELLDEQAMDCGSCGTGVKRGAADNADKGQPQAKYGREGSVVCDMLGVAREFARSHGYMPYYMYRQKNAAGHNGNSGQENIGFALPGMESIYNILIMEEMQTIVACGAGASTKIYDRNLKQVRRIENVKDVTRYIERIGEMIERKRVLFND